MGEKIFFFVIESVAILISLALTSLCVWGHTTMWQYWEYLQSMPSLFFLTQFILSLVMAFPTFFCAMALRRQILVSKYNGFACLITFLLVTAICTYGAIHTPLTMSYQIGGTVLGLFFPLLACIFVAFFVPNKPEQKKEEGGE